MTTQGKNITSKTSDSLKHHTRHRIDKNIPKLHTRKSNTGILILFTSFLLMYFLFTDGSFMEKYALIATLLGVNFVSEFIVRLSYLYEEFRYIHIRYDGRLSELLKAVFYFDKISCMIGIIVCLAFIHCIVNSNVLFEFILFAFCIVGTIRISNIYMGQCPIINQRQLEDLSASGLDFGAGLANSYYYGYLRLLAQELNLLMQRYEANQLVRFHSYKLQILVPSSANCPTTLDNHSPSVSIATTLESIEKDRAGVRKRIYRVSVYKIDTQDGVLYICAEYASPLKTLQDILSYHNKYSTFYKQYKREVIWNFCRTLIELIDSDEETAQQFSLIYFKDPKKNGEQVDVGSLIKKNVEREHKHSKKKRS